MRELVPQGARGLASRVTAAGRGTGIRDQGSGIRIRDRKRFEGEWLFPTHPGTRQQHEKDGAHGEELRAPACAPNAVHRLPVPNRDVMEVLLPKSAIVMKIKGERIICFDDNHDEVYCGKRSSI
jgi:hypothetical protein